MTSRLFTSALFAGLFAGLIAVLLQFSLMEPLILEGEDYESGVKVHFAGILADSDLGVQEEAQVETEDEESLTARFALAFFTDFVVWIGYGLVMVAGFAIAERFGQAITLTAGIFWGLAGFISFQLMPGLGLPPELPGVPAADLGTRQIWWIGTAIASAMAMASVAYGRNPLFIAVGVGLLILPHLIGAPRLDEYLGAVPPGLAAEFVTNSMVLSMATWLTLGLTAGYFWQRQQPSEARGEVP